MDPNTGEKKYGLIIPSKNKGARSGFLSNTSGPKQPNKVFADESSSDDNLEGGDEEEEDEKPVLDWRSRAVAKTAEKSMQRNQARQAALKALEEDPTVFQYDEVYEDMQQKKEEKKPPKEERKPKYIANLLKTAEARKVELERRVERKVQKERETEGDMFNDKEAFVTPAYRAKLAELKKLEEEERLREMREANLDVTKQRDLSGFYRHLYRQTFAEEPKKAEPEEPVTFKKESVESEFKSRRQYRSRREEEEEEQEEEVQEKEGGSSPGQTEQVELTVDNEKSSDADGKSKENRRPAASASLVSAAASDRAAAADRAAEKTVPAAEKSKAIHPETDSESDESNNSKSSPQPEVVQPKVKVDIWKKRTTGHLLDEAIQRYLARKEGRESMVS